MYQTSLQPESLLIESLLIESLLIESLFIESLLIESLFIERRQNTLRQLHVLHTGFMRGLSIIDQLDRSLLLPLPSLYKPRFRK